MRGNAAKAVQRAEFLRLLSLKAYLQSRDLEVFRAHTWVRPYNYSLASKRFADTFFLTLAGSQMRPFMAM